MNIKIIPAMLGSLLLLLASCKDQVHHTAPGDDVKNEAIANKPAPLKVYKKDGIQVKAYDFDKLQYFLNKQTDTTYVVNFWATWCVPCVEELPHFEKLNSDYKLKKVKVLLVSLDMHKMVEAKLIPFIKEKQLQSDVVLLRDPDANSWIGKVDKSWSGAIPATIIYKKDKRQFYEKAFTYEELQKEVNKF